MLSVDDMFPAKILAGRHLTPKGQPFKIVSLPYTVKMRPGRGKPEETKWVLPVQALTADGKPSRVQGVELQPGDVHLIVVRKTLAQMVNAALGVTNAEGWPGRYLVLHAIDERAQGQPVKSTAARALSADWLAKYAGPAAPAVEAGPDDGVIEAKDETEFEDGEAEGDEAEASDDSDQ